jgi:hypothetical protein
MFMLHLYKGVMHGTIICTMWMTQLRQRSKKVHALWFYQGDNDHPFTQIIMTTFLDIYIYIYIFSFHSINEKKKKKQNPL